MAVGLLVCGLSAIRIVFLWDCGKKLWCDAPIYLGMAMSSGLFAASMYLSRVGDYEESGANDVSLGACLMLAALLMMATGLTVGWKHFAEECDEASQKEELKSAAMVEVHRGAFSTRWK